MGIKIPVTYGCATTSSLCRNYFVLSTSEHFPGPKNETHQNLSTCVKRSRFTCARLRRDKRVRARSRQSRRVWPEYGEKESSGVIYGAENKDLVPVQFIEAYVLLNAAPDEFVAVFGAAQEAPTAVESNQKVNAQIEQFLNLLTSWV